MSTNFKPDQSDYKNIGQFRAWCQKVLPLVYDDSVSYYELLGKILQYLNDAIYNINLVGVDMTKLYEAYELLELWVNTYFEDLDVQNEINNKLNTMSTDGSLTELIEPFFNAYNSQVKEVREAINIQNDYIGVLAERMNAFTKLGEGSTTGDAELSDARVDINGRTFANTGEAMRSNQIKRIGYIEDDLDLYTDNADLLASNTALNVPFAELGFVVVRHTQTLPNNVKWCIQIWYSMNRDNFAYRTKVDGAWTKWKSNKHDEKFVTDDLNLHCTASFRGVCDATALNIPTKEVGLIDVVRYSSGGNVWFKQTYTGVNTGNTFYRYYFEAWGWSKWIGVEQVTDKPLTGKTVVFIGDSILGNNQSDTGVVKQFGKLTGANVYNFAFGGTRAKRRNDGKWEHWDGESISEAIANGDFTQQELALENMTDEPTYFANTVSIMKDFDFSTVDYMICNYGTNDYTAGVPSTDYIVAVKTIVDNILTAYPNIVFIKCTPSQRFVETDNGYVSGSDVVFASGGETLKAYVEADMTLKEEYYLDVIDMLHMNINVYNKDTVFTAPDYTHFNANGNAYYAKRLANHF